MIIAFKINYTLDIQNSASTKILIFNKYTDGYTLY